MVEPNGMADDLGWKAMASIRDSIGRLSPNRVNLTMPHSEVLAAADFFTVEVWTRSGLARVVVLFVIELSTRRVEIAGITTQPDGPWMAQIARNLTDDVDGFLVGKRYLIHDRDPLFTQQFRETLSAAGVPTVRLPARSPNLSAYAERFVRSLKESCLDRMILFGERSLRRAVREFVAHYHFERNHQGLNNQLIFPNQSGAPPSAPIKCRRRLGALSDCRNPQAAVSGLAARRRSDQL